MPNLSRHEFEETFDEDVELASAVYNVSAEFWDYVDTLSMDELDGIQHNFTAEFVFVNESRGIEHVMLGTNVQDAYLVIIIDQRSERVTGHHVFHLDPYGDLRVSQNPPYMFE